MNVREREEGDQKIRDKGHGIRDKGLVLTSAITYRKRRGR
jgi:hypothetical protein